jgi:hypothetical protein
MGVVFFCQSCGARFEVEARLAGKKGRCKHCGQYTTVPRPEHLTSMNMPAMAMAGGGGAGGAVAVPRPGPLAAAVPAAALAAARARSMNDWLNASMSKIGLAPLSAPAIPKRPFLPSALDDAADSKPYQVEKPDRREARGKGGGPPNVVLAAWRHEVGLVQKIFRWLNESAYLVSIPFVIILLFGIAVKANSIAIFGAAFVVLLNIGRIVAGVANLAVIPLRDGFNVRKYKKPIRRVVEPVLTIAAVVLAFTFIPWLSSGKASTGSISQRIRATAEGLEQDIKGEVNKVTDKAKNLNLEKLGSQAQEQLKGAVNRAKRIDLNKLGQQAQENRKGEAGSPGDPQAKPGPERAGTEPPQASQVRDLLKDVQRGREVLKEMQKEP